MSAKSRREQKSWRAQKRRGAQSAAPERPGEVIRKSECVRWEVGRCICVDLFSPQGCYAYHANAKERWQRRNNPNGIDSSIKRFEIPSKTGFFQQEKMVNTYQSTLSIFIHSNRNNSFWCQKMFSWYSDKTFFSCRKKCFLLQQWIFLYCKKKNDWATKKEVFLR